MIYGVEVWEQIRSVAERKTQAVERDIRAEIAGDLSLRQLHDITPIPWQLREVLKQRAESWIQRLYDTCCEVQKSIGGELSIEFDRALWAYLIEPFILREVQTSPDGYKASKLMEFLLCAVGSTPEKRRSLRVEQKNCCVVVRNEVCNTWRAKLHRIPSEIDGSLRTMSFDKAKVYPSVRTISESASSLGPMPHVSATPPVGAPVSTPSPSMPGGSDDSIDSNVSESSNTMARPLSEAMVKSKNSAARNWQSIEILFVSDHRLQIRINGKNMESLNFAEFGFADGRSQNPNRAWELLRAMADERGIIRDGKAGGDRWPKIEKRIQEIRKTLRKYFGLPDDPIPFVDGTGYRSLFKISCTKSFHT
jgi:hypothetical protein